MLPEALLLELRDLGLHGSEALGHGAEGGEHPPVGGAAAVLGLGARDEPVVELVDALLLLLELALVERPLGVEALPERVGGRRGGGDAGTEQREADQEAQRGPDDETQEEGENR
ncbi:hypothetical protein GCM10022256_33410 [Frondihabitans peucedani]|uniref:Uncharacterized protein n=1 Tax=Frondihabitans peucedani TaxID=598626 RepID=A0ABP8E6F7_9MICO